VGGSGSRRTSFRHVFQVLIVWSLPYGDSVARSPVPLAALAHASPPQPLTFGAERADGKIDARRRVVLLRMLRYRTFLAIGATIVALALSACGGASSRSSSIRSTFSATPVTFSAPANPVQRENSRPGTTGWEIPAGAGTVITGYASEISVVPGRSVHLHVEAPRGSRYRVLLYRLGWYGGTGGD
jgi:hypothetical protein